MIHKQDAEYFVPDETNHLHQVPKTFPLPQELYVQRLYFTLHWYYKRDKRADDEDDTDHVLHPTWQDQEIVPRIIAGYLEFKSFVPNTYTTKYPIAKIKSRPQAENFLQKDLDLWHKQLGEASTSSVSSQSDSQSLHSSTQSSFEGTFDNQTDTDKIRQYKSSTPKGGSQVRGQVDLTPSPIVRVQYTPDRPDPTLVTPAVVPRELGAKPKAKVTQPRVEAPVRPARPAAPDPEPRPHRAASPDPPVVRAAVVPALVPAAPVPPPAMADYAPVEALQALINAQRARATASDSEAVINGAATEAHRHIADLVMLYELFEEITQEIQRKRDVPPSMLIVKQL